VLALGRFTRLAQVPLRAGAARDADLDRHRLAVDLIAARQNRHALNGVAQLADVARPRVILKRLKHVAGQPLGLEIIARAKLA